MLLGNMQRPHPSWVPERHREMKTFELLYIRAHASGNMPYAHPNHGNCVSCCCVPWCSCRGGSCCHSSRHYH